MGITYKDVIAESVDSQWRHGKTWIHLSMDETHKMWMITHLLIQM